MHPTTWTSLQRWRLIAAFAAASSAAVSTPAQNIEKNAVTPQEAKELKAQEARPASEQEPVVLSPFEVRPESKGYQAVNTLSGTRLNSKLEDLASSITVITKQQLDDTAAADINDIFKYEANTEGTYQYTEYSQDRGFTVDTVAVNPSAANRVRGATQANIANSNFVSSVPIDAYNLDAVEISRGPNSNIFGLGAAGGTVNAITGNARLDRNITTLKYQLDSYGGSRSSWDLNRVLWKDRLSLRISGLYELKGFERRPAYEQTNRLTGAVTIKPFKKTTIKGSYETYHNYNNRANAVTPRDTITDWKAAGSPVWDPTYNAAGTGLAAATGGFRYLNSSTYFAVPVGTTARPNQDSGPNSLPLGLFNDTGGFYSRSALLIDNGQFQFWSINRGTTNAANLAAANSNVRLMQNAGFYQRGNFFARDGTFYPATPLFQQAGISNRDYYDWTSLNFAAPNFGKDKADIYKVEIEQSFLETSRHTLALQLGWFREDIDRYSRNFVGNTDGAPPVVRIDVNEKMLDGTPNPRFLHPYLGSTEVQAFRQPEFNDNYRATLAYQLDLTKESNWVKWLGLHRLAGYGEYRDLRTVTNRFRYRDQMVNGPYLTPANVADLGTAGNFTHFTSRYYMGGDIRDAGRVLDYNAAWLNFHDTYPLTLYNPDGSKVTVPVKIDEVEFSTQNPQKREIRTRGLIWQGFFWDERIVATYGLRIDHLNTVSGDNAFPGLSAGQDFFIDANGYRIPRFTFNDGRLRSDATGRTTSKGLVVKVLTSPKFGLNLHYNESTNFQPEAAAYDIGQGLLPAAQRTALPNPTGNGKDYGFTVNLMDNKLSMKFNHYTTFQRNARNSGAVVFTTRPLRLDFETNFTNSEAQNLEDAAIGWVTQIRYGANSQIALQYGPTNTRNGALADLNGALVQSTATGNPTLVTLNKADAQALIQEAYTKYMGPGISTDYVDWVRTSGVTLADVNDVSSTGNEIEIAYNPTPFWTVKANITQQNAIDTSISRTIGDYIARRYQWWSTLKIPTDTLAGGGQLINAGQNWFYSNGNGLPGNTTNPNIDYFIPNVDSGYDFLVANTGKRRPQTREYRANLVTNYNMAGMFGDNKVLRNMSIGGAVRWEGQAIIGYKAQPAGSDGIIRYLDPNKPMYDKARYYFDLMASYKMKLYNGKYATKFQLNVDNVTENGRLQAVAVNPDGTPWNYRIIDPRRFTFSVAVDL